MKTAIISVVFIFLYLFFINVAFALPDITFSEQEVATPEDNEIGVGNLVEVSVKSPRFYGTVYQADSKRQLSLFNFVPIPLKKDTTNYFYFHIPFMLLVATYNVLQLKGGQE